MANKGTVLVVDDESDMLTLLGKELSDKGYDVQLAHHGREGLESAKRNVPDLLILDVNMPGMDGFQLKTSLNLDEATADIPTIFLSADAKTSVKIEGFNLGADDYVTKPFDMEELMARVDSTLMHHKRAVDLSMTDKLTGLFNRYVYKKQVAVLFKSAKRYGRNFSLAILDIDNLKTANDTLGHKAGDFVIKKVAEAMKATFRQPDILIRYGGDEFVVLFPESSEQQAVNAIRRFKDALEGKAHAMEGLEQKIAISASCGLASYKETIHSEEELFEIADKNLYQEKARKKPL